jgi:hypothetical protein
VVGLYVSPHIGTEPERESSLKAGSLIQGWGAVQAHWKKTGSLVQGWGAFHHIIGVQF